jgi:hypothetical protein
MSHGMSRGLLCVFTLLSTVVAADEGMWTFDNFPAAALKEKYGVEITPAWLDHTRLSTLRLANCTASFVSPDGLALTNSHCVWACLAQISKTGQDRVKDGFLAAGREQELRCETQQADVLMAVENVTAKVNAATAGKDDKAAGEARKKAQTQLEQACEQAAGKQNPRVCESVTLYQGRQYFLYKYKRYTDVRLVFVPENGITQFGGDPDNFQFPRWNIDMTLLRVYENGKPARTPNFLPIDWRGPAENELVLVPGHPGSTDRLLTVAQLEDERAELSLMLLYLSELRGRYLEYAGGNKENARIVADSLYGVENWIKALRKELDALLDGQMMAHKAQDEAALRARAGLGGPQDPWEQIARAQRISQDLRLPYVFLEQGAGFGWYFSRLHSYARLLVRGTLERTKPNEERLREFSDSALPRVEQVLFAETPVYADKEKIALSLGLSRMREYLGPDHPVVIRLMRSASPEALAADLVAKSRLGDAAYRRQLWDGGAAAVAASDDPMIRLEASVDPDARAIRKRYEDEVEAPTDAAAERIAAARFAAYGTSIYPDATFTLRLNFGTVQGWVEGGQPVPPFTYLSRAYERHTGAEPFQLPERWLQARDRLDPRTPFNLSTNNDIVGGNSGSPLVNAKGEMVGLIFDGNIHSISGTYWFDTEKNRAVAVHPAIMRVALTDIYGADWLARELGLH